MLTCEYPYCKCAVSFPEGHKPSGPTECPRMVEEKPDEEMRYIGAAVHNGNIPQILGSVATSLLRIARAQEGIVQLSVQDMNAAIDAAIEERAEAKAVEMMKAKTTRSYIGKK